MIGSSLRTLSAQKQFSASTLLQQQQQGGVLANVVYRVLKNISIVERVWLVERVSKQLDPAVLWIGDPRCPAVYLPT